MCSKVLEMLDKIIRATVMLFLVLVGSLVSAVTGAFTGVTTDIGLLRGAAAGAIFGAIFMFESIESSGSIWNSIGLQDWSIVNMIDRLCIFNRRLIEENFSLAIQRAIENHTTAVNFNESNDTFECCGTKGMARDSIYKLPKIEISSKDYMDDSGDRIRCAVCLQDLQIGETARRLPNCNHTFHLVCINDWLIKHGSCPLCRHAC